MADLGISWADGGLVVLATICIYAVTVSLVRLSGPRSVASFSTFDFVVSVALGAVVGRVVLVSTSLLAGVIGLVTLFVIERAVGLARRRRGVRRALDAVPRLLVDGGVVDDDRVRAARLTRGDVLEQLRRRGYGSLVDVQAAILERDGEISVVPAGRRIDDSVLAGVDGWSAASRRPAGR